IGACMPTGSIDDEIQDAYLQLSRSAAVAAHCHERYLDGFTWHPEAGQDPFGELAALTAAHPWALSGFGDPAWDAYRPDVDAPVPDGLRIGVLRTKGLPAVPALA